MRAVKFCRGFADNPRQSILGCGHWGLTISIEHRHYKRLACAGDATFYPGTEVAGWAAKMKDLSVEGGLVRLCDPHAIEPGGIIEVAFSVNQLPFRVRAEVKVVRSPTEIGIHFVHVNERVRQHLDDLIEELGELSSRGGQTPPPLVLEQGWRTLTRS